MPDKESKPTNDTDSVRLAAKRDDVELVRYSDPWPVPATRAERRARRHVLAWFGLSVASGLAFVCCYLFWPSAYVQPGMPGHDWYVLYTPMLGLTLGTALLSIFVGLVLYVKRFMPKELAVQQRHDEPSAEIDQQTAVAVLDDAGKQSGLKKSTVNRRTWMGRAVGAAAGVAGVGAGIAVAGSFVKNPWTHPASPESLWHTGWAPIDGEKVYLRMDVADPHAVVLVRPADLVAGSMATVVPFRESERGDHEQLLAATRRADNPAMLFRFRPEDPVVSSAGREQFHFGDFYAYSKLCTHLGCPASLFEMQTNRLVCPCHQSQFDLNAGARPVFGPAARALPQLPITIDEDGYFIATGDFSAPVGPGFWELG
ncbi:ubiquinol-cytochrome c reductase iron-sulfur subunit [Kibdelosporangium aridum]|uniref:Cytochrome bc1 complex Rieske iron-sulfur subunit n=1 Tax=Kibdelosporangium aridum TaxID=2030 RepID=A0A428ZBA1_KIBAR|nr:ubiquinol-cytochrome c reductase iron-sulfur subunit [Kibdelosporangium aridum]RSM85248.1 ubiquinol-cytochrome c reductase iron-sulfur subunit [Kibdelosporangium aridum]